MFPVPDPEAGRKRISHIVVGGIDDGTWWQHQHSNFYSESEQELWMNEWNATK